MKRTNLLPKKNQNYVFLTYCGIASLPFSTRFLTRVVVVLSQKQVSHLSHLSKKDSSHQGQMGQVGHIKSGYGNYIYARAYVRACRDFVR